MKSVKSEHGSEKQNEQRQVATGADACQREVCASYAAKTTSVWKPAGRDHADHGTGVREMTNGIPGPTLRRAAKKTEKSVRFRL